MWFLSTWWTADAVAQTADEPWLTIRTEHFRVHYPADAAPWAEEAASRLEGWHARVMAEVGWVPPRVIDAVIVDPYSDANGLAVPWSTSPRTMWFATPPEAASVIGHFRAWDEDLVVHEDTHLVHMMRAPRNAWERAAYQLFGFGPIATKGPRWVVEGYATVVEGRLTGFGRPNGDGRAMLLRRLAQRGELPQYSELDANGSWGGGGYAYLVGSAYLEWLEARAGEGSLRDLWARMTARDSRSFVEAFTGVFADPPDVLYRRFCAEITASAMAAEAGEPVDARPFQELGWTVGNPDVSPDGSKVAVPRFPRRGPPAIEIWSLAEDEDAAKERAEAQAELLEKDPEDVAPVPPAHPPHERLDRRRSRGYAARELHWTADGEALLFSAWTRDASGRFRPDLYRWTLDGDRTERITRRADVRAPDPAPDGTWAAAVHTDWGRTQIVRVDLATGALTPITPLSLTQVDGPRVSPDGRRVAWLENSGAGFGAVVLDLESGERFALDPGPGGLVAYSLAWTPDGRGLLATVGLDGFVELTEIWRDGGRGRGRLTATSGIAVAADPIDADRALYLSMTRQGLDLAEAPLAPRGDPPAGGAAPVRRPPSPAAPGLPPRDPVHAEPYGWGPTDLSALAGGSIAAASEQGQVEFGVRAGDPVGRSELLLLGGIATDRGGAYGGRAEWTVQRLPLRLGLDAWLGGDEALDTRRGGAGLELYRRTGGPWWRASARAAGLAEAALAQDEHGPRQLAYLAGGVGAAEPSQGWVTGGVGVTGTLGSLGGAGYGQGQIALDLGSRGLVDLHYELGAATGDHVMDRFSLGGVGSALVYAPGDLWRVEDPAYRAAIAQGRRHDYAEIAVGGPSGIYLGRHRIADRLADVEHGFTAAGLRLDLGMDGQPFFRVPAVHATAGLACRLEYPGLGWDPHPCQHADDYTAWAGVTWGR